MYANENHNTANIIVSLAQAAHLLETVTNAQCQQKNLLAAIDKLTAQLSPALQDEVTGD